MFELAKASFLVVLSVTLYIDPNALSRAGSTLRLLISVATNHIVRMDSNLNGRSLIVIVFALYAINGAVFGFGLLFLKRWARTILMWTSGVYLIRYAQALLFRDWASGVPTIRAEPAYTAIAVVDAIILMYLYIGKEAFSGKVRSHND